MGTPCLYSACSSKELDDGFNARHPNNQMRVIFTTCVFLGLERGSSRRGTLEASARSSYPDRHKLNTLHGEDKS